MSGSKAGNSECVSMFTSLQYISRFWTCFFFFSLVPCFVCSGSSQWSVKKVGVDLTDHPWVMMMRGLLLLKLQEVRVCSCRGSSVHVSSPSKNNLKTVLLTYGSSSFGPLLCCVSADPWRNRIVFCLFFVIFYISEHTEVMVVFTLRSVISNNKCKFT